MKVLKNWASSICNDCGKPNTATLTGSDYIICGFCFSQDLKDKDWKVFEPLFVPDSRNQDRKWHSQHLRRYDDMQGGRYGSKEA